MTIKYLKGDVLKAALLKNEKVVIPHICNNMGGWGAGFVVAISNIWPGPEKSYREWSRDPDSFRLGNLELVQVTPNIRICNMIAQDNFPTSYRRIAVDYQALETCLQKLAKALPEDVLIMMPRIGCGIGGGNWEEVERIINKTLDNFQVEVYTL
jgi:O-acetyl-ADP-ribose deacetylase (regulator of RNase III)